MDCGRLIRAARRARCLSQRELAACAGVPRSTVARIEAGRVEPRVQMLVHLLEVLGFRLAVTDGSGASLEPDDEQDRLRDAAGRRLPAHLKAFKTPDYFDRDAPAWWGWHHVAWPFGVGDRPEYTYYHRRRER